MVGRQPADSRQAAANPLKLLHVVSSYLPATRYGGTIVSVHGICRALAARGHDVHVYTTSVDGATDSAVAHGEPVDVDAVKVWYFKSHSFRRGITPAQCGRLFDTLLPFRRRAHARDLFMAALGGGACARRAGVPYVVSPRGMLEKELIERKSAIWKAALIGFASAPIWRRRGVHVTSGREAAEARRSASRCGG